MASSEQRIEARDSGEPGKTLGVIALVLSVFCVPLVGVLIGIFAWLKSRAAGHGNLFAVLAIIINLIYTVLLFLFLGSIQATLEKNRQPDVPVITEQSSEAQVMQADVDTDQIAAELQRKLDKLREARGTYPSWSRLLAEQGALALTDEQRAVLINSATPPAGKVGFQSCVASNGVSSGVMLRPGSGNSPLVAGDCSNIAARRE